MSDISVMVRPTTFPKIRPGQSFTGTSGPCLPRESAQAGEIAVRLAVGCMGTRLHGRRFRPRNLSSVIEQEY